MTNPIRDALPLFTPEQEAELVEVVADKIGEVDITFKCEPWLIKDDWSKEIRDMVAKAVLSAIKAYMEGKR